MSVDELYYRLCEVNCQLKYRISLHLKLTHIMDLCDIKIRKYKTKS